MPHPAQLLVVLRFLKLREVAESNKRTAGRCLGIVAPLTVAACVVLPEKLTKVPACHVRQLLEGATLEELRSSHAVQQGLLRGGPCSPASLLCSANLLTRFSVQNGGRQLLQGATAEDLRSSYAVLQGLLREAPGSAPADALPALEASLLALETASGRSLASQVCFGCSP